MNAERAARALHWRWNTVGHIAAGLASLGAALLVGVALWFDAPEAFERIVRRESMLRESVARTALPLIARGDRAALQTLLDRVLQEDTAWSSIVVRRADGVMFGFARNEDSPNRAAPNRVAPNAGPGGSGWHRLPIESASGTWGAIEFRPRDDVTSLSSFDGWRWLAAVGSIGLLAFGIFYLYLQRALSHLDPASVVPERVRHAFDVLTQGVLFLDANGRIVLANSAFETGFSSPGENLTGRSASSFGWLAGRDGEAPLWTRVMRQGRPVRDETCAVPQPGGGTRRVVVQAVPVQDAKGRVHGCVLTFDDLTALDTANAGLRQALGELEASRAQIAEQNVKLKDMASRDPLTGCLNRRALQEAFEPLLALARRQDQPVACVMFDIDHFKRVNDQHGHAVGDAVIRSIARIVGERIRGSDLLCRYGGEEFCLVLPYTSTDAAVRIAESLRATVERECGRSGEVPGLRVTASFGVSSTRQGPDNLDALMELADKALYAAKHGGRNRVERSDVTPACAA